MKSIKIAVNGFMVIVYQKIQLWDVGKAQELPLEMEQIVKLPRKLQIALLDAVSYLDYFLCSSEVIHWACSSTECLCCSWG